MLARAQCETRRISARCWCEVGTRLFRRRLPSYAARHVISAGMTLRRRLKHPRGAKRSPRAHAWYETLPAPHFTCRQAVRRGCRRPRRAHALRWGDVRAGRCRERVKTSFDEELRSVGRQLVQYVQRAFPLALASVTTTSTTQRLAFAFNRLAFAKLGAIARSLLSARPLR